MLEAVPSSVKIADQAVTMVMVVERIETVRRRRIYSVAEPSVYGVFIGDVLGRPITYSLLSSLVSVVNYETNQSLATKEITINYLLFFLKPVSTQRYRTVKEIVNDPVLPLLTRRA